jgi:multimeric flavodoxin WrbA
MNIAILNGDSEAASPFQAYLLKLSQKLKDRGHTVIKLDLATLNLKGCSGCWGCWVKTPGECVKHDGSATVRRAIIDSDLTLLASPITMGFTSALLKRAADQMVPLIHPYFVVEGGEIHHRARYARYPLMALLLDAGEQADAEDIEMTTAIWRRTARNLKTRLAFTAVASRDAEEVANELTLVA